MKFGKSLSNQIEETLPEWRDKFLSYKDLKKRLKLIGTGGERPAKRARVGDDDGCSGDRSPAAMEAAEGTSMTREEENFMKLLEAELEKFNSFFVEKEEDYVIRQKELQDRVVRVEGKESKEELMRVWKRIVDFHGEMVLLENYSALNYTGLVKILKKYDKRTGALIRLPFIQKVLQEPFFTTDLLYKLVKQCEAMLDCLFPKREPYIPYRGGGGESSGGDKKPFISDEDGSRENSDGDKKPSKTPGSSLVSGGFPDLEEIEYVESLYMKSTVSALRVLKEMRSGSSTISVFSLPPLQTNGMDDCWHKIPVLEQLAG